MTYSYQLVSINHTLCCSYYWYYYYHKK